MRAILAASLLALLLPAGGLAQTRAGDISRDDYINRAVERARHAAEKRFDKMDANHDGVLTAEERRAARAERAQQRAAPSPPGPSQ